VLLLTFLSIVFAYLIGSVSSSYIVGLVSGKVDMRAEPDGRVSAAAIYRKVGPLAYAIAVMADIGLAVSAVTVARVLTGSQDVMMLAGIATVAGHNWSPFLKFKGGLGATTMCGAIGSMAYIPFIYGLLVAGVIFATTQKSGLSSGIGFASISGFILLQNGYDILFILPIALLALMLLKRVQLSRAMKSIAGPQVITLPEEPDSFSSKTN
jgi:glycerol-3-phosphate acyltransferase PlsY